MDHDEGKKKEKGALSGIPDEKGTGGPRKHPVAPCTKGENLDGKGNVGLAARSKSRGTGGWCGRGWRAAFPSPREVKSPEDEGLARRARSSVGDDTRG